MITDEVLITPDSPTLLPNQNTLLYAPLASYYTYGVVKIGGSRFIMTNSEGAIDIDLIALRPHLKGDTGEPPHIGENGNWWVSYYSYDDGHFVSEDTGMPAQGPQGVQGPVGADGYSPRFKVEDSRLYVKNSESSAWEYLGLGIFSTERKVAFGEDAYAITNGSVAIGDGSIAGSRGFAIAEFNHSARRIKIKRTSPFDGTTAEVVYSSGDKFSIINETHYAFCGTITKVSGDYIYYTPSTDHGTVTSRTEAWWTPTTNTQAILYGVYGLLWVPSKPLVGYNIRYDGEDAFQNATAFNGGYATTKGSIVTADQSYAGGNYAAIFGPDIQVGYGTISSGRGNRSYGLHSALLGRDLHNYGDYNLQGGRSNRIDKGNYNLQGGQGNIINGSGCLVGGTSIRVSAGNVFASGGGHTITHSYMGAIGYRLTSTRNGQFLVGQLNEPTVSGNYPDLLVVAYGDSVSGTPKNLLTVNDKGTLQKDTDAVTYKHLRDYVTKALKDAGIT